MVQGDIGNVITVYLNEKHFKGHYIKPSVKGAKCKIQLRLQKKTNFALYRTSGVMTSAVDSDVSHCLCALFFSSLFTGQGWSHNHVSACESPLSPAKVVV